MTRKGLAFAGALQLVALLSLHVPSPALAAFSSAELKCRDTIAKLGTKLSDLVDLRPASIIERFQLKRPIYRPTASYGHFGRPATDGLFPWEKTDLAAALA